MEFVELTEKEFSEFAEGARGANFLQSIYMLRRYQKIGREAYLLGVKRRKKLIVAALVSEAGKIKGQKIFNIPGGYLGDYGEEALRTFTEGAKEFLRGKKAAVLMMSPNIVSEERDIDAEIVPGGESNLGVKKALRHLGYRYLGEYAQAKWIYVLPTKGADEDTVYKDFRKGHKLSIRYAEPRYKVKIRELSVEELPILEELVDEASDFHGFKAPTLKYFKEMKEAFSEKVRFMVAEMPDPETGKIVPVAGAMFVLYGPEIVYLFSGSRRAYKKYGGPHLMQWQMIQEAIAKGYERYNFYGVRPEAGNGVYAFKRGFKGKVVELLGTFMLPISSLGKVYTMSRKVQKFGKIQ